MPLGLALPAARRRQPVTEQQAVRGLVRPLLNQEFYSFSGDKMQT